jgi:hypothetical protein
MAASIAKGNRTLVLHKGCSIACLGAVEDQAEFDFIIA